MGGSMNHTTRAATSTSTIDMRLVTWAASRKEAKATCLPWATEVGRRSPCAAAWSSTGTVPTDRVRGQLASFAAA